MTLPSQVGFYLLPPEANNSKSRGKRNPNSNPIKEQRHWKSQNNLDVIAEASDESRASTPKFVAAALKAVNSPRLLRKNTALPGLMFDRPTRHPSLDDLRGYGRKKPQHNNNSRAGLGSGPAYDHHQFHTKLPPLRQVKAYDSMVNEDKCFHPQSKICENLKHSLHMLKVRGHNDVFESLVGAVVVGPDDVEPADAAEILGVNSEEFLKSKFRRNSIFSQQNVMAIPPLPLAAQQPQQPQIRRDAQFMPPQLKLSK